MPCDDDSDYEPPPLEELGFKKFRRGRDVLPALPDRVYDGPERPPELVNGCVQLYVRPGEGRIAYAYGAEYDHATRLWFLPPTHLHQLPNHRHSWWPVDWRKDPPRCYVTRILSAKQLMRDPLFRAVVAEVRCDALPRAHADPARSIARA